MKAWQVYYKNLIFNHLILPFNIGLNPLAIYDVENEKIYTNIKIDSEEAAKELVNTSGKALGFAHKIMYYCRDTIGYFLAKANLNGEVLSKLQLEENKEEKKDETEKNIDISKKDDAGWSEESDNEDPESDNKKPENDQLNNSEDKE